MLSDTKPTISAIQEKQGKQLAMHETTFRQPFQKLILNREDKQSEWSLYGFWNRFKVNIHYTLQDK